MFLFWGSFKNLCILFAKCWCQCTNLAPLLSLELQLALQSSLFNGSSALLYITCLLCMLHEFLKNGLCLFLFRSYFPGLHLHCLTKLCPIGPFGHFIYGHWNLTGLLHCAARYEFSLLFFARLCGVALFLCIRAQTLFWYRVSSMLLSSFTFPMCFQWPRSLSPSCSLKEESFSTLFIFCLGQHP